MEYYYNEKGQVGVLISSGFGAGFSTWNGNDIKLALDKRIIEFWLMFKGYYDFLDQLEKFLISIGYPDNLFLIGASSLKLVWVDKGSLIRINEYDGAETLEVFDENNGWYKV